MRPNDKGRPYDSGNDDPLHEQGGWLVAAEEQLYRAPNPYIDFEPARSSTMDRAPVERTVRDVLSIGFRQKRKILATFLICLTAGVCWLARRPVIYESEMKILVRRERAEEVVSSQLEQIRGTTTGVRLEDVNTEAQVLTSRELARQVLAQSDALRASMAPGTESGFWRSIGWRVADGSDEVDEAKLVDGFLENLVVAPSAGSNIIRVAFRSEDREIAAESLQALSGAYLAKHLEVHRTQGSAEVFAAEASQHRAELDSLQDQLFTLGRRHGAVDISIEKESILRELLARQAEFESGKAAIASLQSRLESLQKEVMQTPQRRTTSVRTSPMLLENLRQELNRLELERIELESKFLPTYEPVVRIREQIQATQAAIEKAQNAPPVEEITDRDPTHDWVSSEIARTRSDLVAARSNQAEISKTIVALRARSNELESLNRTRVELERDASAAERNFVAYRQRAEEARISGELDQQRVLNVAVAEAPSVPSAPAGPSRFLLLLGLIAVSGAASLGIGLSADVLDPTYRRPDELEKSLGIPVLTSIPKV
jgi:uncharacterized protein involved in exopolysaccharide biosynthesis